MRIDFRVRQVTEPLRCQVWEMPCIELREEMGSQRESWPVQGEVMERELHRHSFASSCKFCNHWDFLKAWPCSLVIMSFTSSTVGEKVNGAYHKVQMQQAKAEQTPEKLTGTG